MKPDGAALSYGLKPERCDVLVAVTLRSRAPHGACELALSGHGHEPAGSTSISTTACRILFPRVDPGELPTAIVANTSGGLVGGDRLRVDVAVEDGGARGRRPARRPRKSIARSAPRPNSPCTRRRRWRLARISAPGDHPVRWRAAGAHDRIAVDRGARFMAGDICRAGRTARGERFDHGLLQDRWAVRVDGRLVWADALRLADDIPALRRTRLASAAPSPMRRLLYVAPDAAERLACLRELIEKSGVGAARPASGRCWSRGSWPRRRRRSGARWRGSGRPCARKRRDCRRRAAGLAGLTDDKETSRGSRRCI